MRQSSVDGVEGFVEKIRDGLIRVCEGSVKQVLPSACGLDCIRRKLTHLVEVLATPFRRVFPGMTAEPSVRDTTRMRPTHSKTAK